ncbi:MAG: hypothetical protein LKE85_19165 [Lachnospiraceae bacterium]|jgi:DNA-binding transcriptional regulator YhcF (GntR family)|nr:hypothetical protein [Lachnospiraceae bacterium]
MLTYSFENIGNQSLFTHLYECIKHDVLTGSLAPGTRLPSKRMFAKALVKNRVDGFHTTTSMVNSRLDNV